MGEYLAEQVRCGRFTYNEIVQMYPQYKDDIDKYLEEYSYIEIEDWDIYPSYTIRIRGIIFF